MHPTFKNYVENLHPAFDKLVSMQPLRICDGAEKKSITLRGMSVLSFPACGRGRGIR
jgi:hypothetical protein